MMRLGETIRSIRQQSGLAQNAAAAASGVSPQYWSDIERGRRVPPPETIARIENALNVPTPTLLWAWVQQNVGDETAALMLRVCGTPRGED